MMLPNGRQRILSAMFVDFDNVYITLQKQDLRAASRFANDPGCWMEWLEQQLPSALGSSEEIVRRILVRRCYLNPTSFGKFRPFFVRCGFEVIDCPALAFAPGLPPKTAADMHMVLDMVDALNQPARIDEFIILSGDSDFTPILVRLRKHDRYSAVLAVGQVSPIYKASCDHVISREAFVNEALGVAMPDDAATSAADLDIGEFTSDQPLLKRMATAIYRAIDGAEGIVADRLPDIYLDFAEFRDRDDWLGYGSLRRLTQALARERDDLLVTDEDVWRVVRSGAGEATPAPTPIDPEEAKPVIAEIIVSAVRAAERPMTLAALAQLAIERYGRDLVIGDWLGAGTFKRLLEQIDLDGLEFADAPPGFLLDPTRHKAPPGPEPLDDWGGSYPHLVGLVRKVHQLTDTPYLAPSQYAQLFTELADEINSNGYHMSITSKAVRDRCAEAGSPVARAHVNFCLIGIGYVGHRFGEGTETPLYLAERLVENTIQLCRSAQFELSEQEKLLLRHWIVDGLDPNAEEISASAAETGASDD